MRLLNKFVPLVLVWGVGKGVCAVGALDPTGFSMCGAFWAAGPRGPLSCSKIEANMILHNKVIPTAA